MAATTSVTILLTRPQAASERFAGLLRPHLTWRTTLLISPILEIEMLPLRSNLQQFDALVITSQNALRVIQPRAAIGMRTFCVGEKTADSARKLGLDVRIVESDLRALAKQLKDNPPPGRLLHLRGEHVAGDLVGLLGETSLFLSEEIVYQQSALALKKRAINALSTSGTVILPIFSPRSGSLLMESLSSEMESVRIAICMSEAVASVLESAKIDTIQCAEDKTAQSMRDAVLANVG